MFLASLVMAIPILASSSVNVRVENNVGGGDAEVNTTIKSTVNGETKVVETHEPGVVEVKGDESGFEVTQEGSAKVEETDEGVKPEAEVSVTGEPEVNKIEGVIIEDEGGAGRDVGGWMQNLFKEVKGWWEEVKVKLFL